MVVLVVADYAVQLASAHHLVAAAGNLQPRRLRAYAFQSFMLVAALPVVLLGAAAAQLVGERQITDGTTRMQEAATAIRDHLDDYFRAHAQSIDMLADAVGQLGDLPDQRKMLVASYGKSYSEFSRVGVLSPSGDVVFAVPPRPAGAGALGGTDFFLGTMRTNRVTISDLGVGSVTRHPRVIISRRRHCLRRAQPGQPRRLSRLAPKPP
jgi:hypothetical protein